MEMGCFEGLPKELQILDTNEAAFPRTCLLFEPHLFARMNDTSVNEVFYVDVMRYYVVLKACGDLVARGRSTLRDVRYCVLRRVVGVSR